MNEMIKHKIKHNIHRAVVSVKWIIFAVIVGVIVGLCGTAFYFCLSLVTVLRTQYHWLLFLLPVGGLAIVAMYRLLHNEKDTGTNLVLSLYPPSSHTFSVVLRVVKVLHCRWAEVSAMLSASCSVSMKKTNMS